MATPRRYAEGTAVAVARSIAEIQRLVKAHGGTGWRYEELDEQAPPAARITFSLAGWPIRFTVVQPRLEDFEETPTGLLRSASTMAKLRDEEERRRWREVLLLIKAKFVAIDAGVVEARSEFLGSLVLDNDQTVAEYVVPQLQASAAQSQSLRLLPPASITEEVVE